jgi:hypothetical protein
MTQDAGQAESGPLWNHFWNTGAGGDTESEMTVESGAEFSSNAMTSPRGHYHAAPAAEPSPFETHSQAIVNGNKKSVGGSMSFKLRHALTGQVYRFSLTNPSFQDLLNRVSEQTGLSVSSTFNRDSGKQTWSLRETGKDLVLSYFDEDGDGVLLGSDKDLTEALEMAKRGGWTRLELFVGSGVLTKSERERLLERRGVGVVPLALGGGLVTLAALGALYVFLMAKK